MCKRALPNVQKNAAPPRLIRGDSDVVVLCLAPPLDRVVEGHQASHMPVAEVGFSKVLDMPRAWPVPAFIIRR
ncbi:hypothetical protein LT42_07190 [Pseudomonas lutea]|uniref:Uncharacterized protein n=1 Tax=Pseudomonas lutea TaxID=243924 RepID=A0A9X0EH36_9PSED|nr:hypothetical protein LT42_07190 [Pseudomonas lutea]